MTTCPFCGYQYEQADVSTCSGCPMAGACTMACCPRCGYKMPTESRLGKFIRKLTTRGDARENAGAAAKR